MWFGFDVRDPMTPGDPVHVGLIKERSRLPLSTRTFFTRLLFPNCIIFLLRSLGICRENACNVTDGPMPHTSVVAGFCLQTQALLGSTEAAGVNLLEVS